MSPRRAPATAGKRVPYRAPRDRRELWMAIAAASLILIVTASLVWFVRPNRESTSAPPSTTGDVTFNTVPTTPPTASTAAPTDTTPITPTDNTTAPPGG
jgi:hypothetical protein